MKLAVCSRSSTASRSPPSEILGTLAVADLPTGFARRSSILFVAHDRCLVAYGTADWELIKRS
jgi:hypothetical protein